MLTGISICIIIWLCISFIDILTHHKAENIRISNKFNIIYNHCKLPYTVAELRARV